MQEKQGRPEQCGDWCWQADKAADLTVPDVVEPQPGQRAGRVDECRAPPDPLAATRGPEQNAGDDDWRDAEGDRIGKAIELVEGSDVTVAAHGLMVAEAIRAAEALEGEGVSVRVIDLHTIKPLDRDAIAKAAAETGAIVVCEEHLVDSGLGVRVAQVVAETNPCVMEFVGIQNTYAESASPEALLNKYGLLARDVMAAVRRVLSRKR